MRFITEFEVLKAEYRTTKEYQEHLIQVNKARSECELGHTLVEQFGWQNPIHTDSDYYRLEIEAFPMSEWIEFKNKLLFEIQESAIHGIPISPIRTLELIKSLESFGKPVGENK